MNGSLARRCIILAGVVPFLSGCFTYVPAEIEAVPAGENVRIYLTREGMAALPELPLEDGPVVRGTLVRREGELLLLRVPIASRREGFHTATIGQNVRVPTGEIVQLERRRLDRVGTGLLVAGTAASAAAVVLLILEGSRGGTERPPPEPPELRIPLLFIPVR